MSHQLDIDGMLEKLVLLQHFSYGSQKYCGVRLIGSEHDAGDGEFDEYWGWVKGIVSNYTLECSIRLRVLLDITAESPNAAKIINLDKAARSGIKIGQVIDGNFELTLRETCNKIIHARKAIPVWSTSVEDNVEFKYWSGNYELSGTKGSKTWKLLLHIGPWARCVEKFLTKASASELTLYVGQDWY